MASQKISQFTAITTLVSGDYFPVIQSSDTSNKRVDVGVLDVRYTSAASGVAAQSTANEALASGAVAYTALASGNSALVDAATALASGNAGLSSSATALASGNSALVVAGSALSSGNAALSDLNNKYDKTGGPISGPVSVQSQAISPPTFIEASGVVILDFGASNNFEITLTSGTQTFASPVNASGGQTGVIVLRQDSVGSRLAVYSGSWSFQGNTPPTLTTTASGVDVLAFYVVNPNRITTVATLDYGSGVVA